MHNKEMLLGVGRRDAPYTHTVIVGAYDKDPSNAIGYAHASYGVIDPKGVNNVLINTILVDKYKTRTQFTLGLTHYTMPFYLARADRELVLRPDQADIDNINAHQIWKGLTFFTEDDVGKSIPIWISRDPLQLSVTAEITFDLDYYVEEVPWEAQNAE